jgi:predicted Na+-dependent transporter
MVRFLANITFPFMVMVLVIAAMPWVVPAGAGWLDNVVSAAIRLGFMMLSLGLALWVANRDGELMAIVRLEWKHRFGSGKTV